MKYYKRLSKVLCFFLIPQVFLANLDLSTYIYQQLHYYFTILVLNRNKIYF